MATLNSKVQYPENNDEAAKLYLGSKQLDPLPQIEAGLLSSADIVDYVVATGMVHPFHPEDVKSASYGLRLKGKVVYWDKSNNKTTKILSDEIIPKYENYSHVEEVIIPSNSISFVSLEPKLRLPNYIAARFNLRIKQVYRGFLLGTGPLVDPGFDGYLSFPLHNLTDNDYTISFNEEIVWMEFTKLSTKFRWTGSEPGLSRQGEFVEFTKELRMDVDDYLRHSNNGQPIASSIPVAVEASQKAAESAERRVRKLEIAGIASAIIAILVATWGAFELTTDLTSLVRDVQNELHSQRNSVSDAAMLRISELEDKLESLAQVATVGTLSSDRLNSLEDDRYKIDEILWQLEVLKQQILTDENTVPK